MTVSIVALSLALSACALAFPRLLGGDPTRIKTKEITERQRFWQFIGIIIASRVFMMVLAWVFMKLRGGTDFLKFYIDDYGDTPHYLRIAQYGYTNDGGVFDKQIVFYPLLPMLIKGLAFILYPFGKTYELGVWETTITIRQNYVLAGYIITNIATVIGCGYFYKLLRMDYTDRTARDTVYLMLLYPVAFFMCFIFTEGLFFCLCVMTLYYARQGRFVLSGLVGFLAALTRNQGFLVFGAAGYEYLVQARNNSHQNGKSFWQNLKPGGAALLAIPAGYGVYMLLNHSLFGSYNKNFEFLQEAPWWQNVGWMPEIIGRQFEWAVEHRGLAFSIYIPQLFVFFLGLALCYLGYKKRVRTSYLLHILAFTLMSFSATWLISGFRYMLSCTFMFIPLALQCQKPYWRAAVFSGTAILCVLFFMMFSKHYSIM